ncbi:hypothetical protein EHI8A_000960 [Entamoeba histolytica HM-1:IMSS-B]|uniref:Uncharacterized protein n=8 Tax=Entamoeba TaxID=5758 RepID=B1N391_ENTH1|nr:hypothetical protein EHI_024690 [Entamoeba histolytica HM-1:IMSS]XP_008854979.1 hypothetical protein ENU1_013900 [Entamoeba nuttalli P19]EMD46236.1 Hypothetical protein EHI5A_011040 [Entamoeba histolytica KU27]EMH73948.1 hypothetical protein EHI8A_000960 [Entamoeba histolytica HM-1:IMSS-B]EMS11655.1 hypothetical protein KM1_011090 [Entamoeba histolytica HM-3:IMSS]ENY65390.1 hypothetical protein EHI7A_002720 [Entamoeba histolytica HM-1:IMSS-A]GAT94703.1 hypothetical protein CL6EHI_024690 [E|eukprot:XP_008854979.1 hypothetical protein ENU1_013900 [Entamoeba nuttalli P19]
MVEEIHHHTFKVVEQPTNPVISLLFSIFVISAFVFLLISLIRTIQFKKLHFGFFGFLFIIVLSATFVFIAYFWFFLTLLEAVGLFLLIAPVTCLFAFCAAKASL